MEDLIAQVGHGAYALVGLAEFAEVCGTSGSIIVKWRKAYSDFPQPIQELACGPIWFHWQAKQWNSVHKVRRYNYRDRLSNEQVAEINALLDFGWTQTRIAKHIGCSQTTINKFHQQRVFETIGNK